jgi:hypothetical protein
MSFLMRWIKFYGDDIKEFILKWYKLKVAVGTIRPIAVISQKLGIDAKKNKNGFVTFVI